MVTLIGIALALVVSCLLIKLLLSLDGQTKKEYSHWEAPSLAATPSPAPPLVLKTPWLSSLPERFIVLDLETTGFDHVRNEIIEIAAIRVNRDSTDHETFQALIRPQKRILKLITKITGITMGAYRMKAHIAL
jgi:DNA polymerase III epsilon subunit-like protein